MSRELVIIAAVGIVILIIFAVFAFKDNDDSE